MTTVHPVRITRQLPQTRIERFGAAVVRRALPVLAGSAAALVATVAAERAIRELALGTMQRSGGDPVTTAFVRTVVTEVIVERSLRRA